MRKLRLYLDTSTISHLFANDTLDKMRDTNLLWEDMINLTVQTSNYGKSSATTER